MSTELTDQVERLHSRRERWPQNIISDWKNRSMPVFSAESITKLNQNYLSEVERVNDARKCHKDSLKTDINRKKKHLDDIQSKHAQATNTYELSLNQLRSELALHGPQPSWDKNQLRAKILC